MAEPQHIRTVWRTRSLDLLALLTAHAILWTSLFWLVRSIELSAQLVRNTLPPNAWITISAGYWNDCVAGLRWFGGSLPLLMAIGWFAPRVARMASIVLASLLFIVGTALSFYYLSTNTLLGSDLFAYSWNDIRTTISSSARLDWGPVILLLGGIALWIVLIRSLAGRTYRPAAVLIVLGVLACSVFLPTFGPRSFTSEADGAAAAVRINHFLASILSDAVGRHSAANGSGYPFYRAFPYQDVLAPFLGKPAGKPNIVVIIVEGLGREFTGRGATYQGFTPFLDSLAEQNLFWENFLSNTGRTFGVLPSLFGSLPFGPNGFMDLADSMPAHQTLIRLLKERGYLTSFFHGGPGNFDLQDVFLERQGIDNFLDQSKFDGDAERMHPDEGGYSWGYPDGELYRRALQWTDRFPSKPRLDIYLTLSSHEPFIPPQNEAYLARVDRILGMFHGSARAASAIASYRPVFASLLYVDDALRGFFDAYRRRPEYANTIFIVTGDHRLIPVPQAASIDRYRVPFIIASPLVLRSRVFSSVSSHQDVTPTLIAWLRGCGIEFPAEAHWIGTGIDTAVEFRNGHSIPLMRTKGERLDLIQGDHFLSGDRLFRIHAGLETEEVTGDPEFPRLSHDRDLFSQMNRYVCLANRLMPAAHPESHTTVLPQVDSLFAAIRNQGLNTDQEYMLARRLAFEGNYLLARALCEQILRRSPNYHDVRMLLGRTYAWNGERRVASEHFLEVQRRAPGYYDSYGAMADLELWDGNPDSAATILERAVHQFPDNQELLLQQGRLFRRRGNTDAARTAVARVLRLNPRNAEAAALMKALTP